MDDYKVDIRFPKRDDSLVVITGDEDNVLDAKDYLLNIAEEYVSIFTNICISKRVNNLTDSLGKKNIKYAYI